MGTNGYRTSDKDEYKKQSKIQDEVSLHTTRVQDVYLTK